MLFEIENRGGTISIVNCVGALAHADSLVPLNGLTDSLYDQGVYAVAINCSRVSRFTSAGLAGFVDMLLQQTKVRTAVFNLPPKLKSRVHDLGYDRVLPIFNSEEEVLSSQHFRCVSLANTKAVLLCAGRGSRIAPLSEVCPKPMLDILGKPLLARAMDSLQSYGVRDILLNPGHLGYQIPNYFRKNPRREQSVTFYNEGKFGDEGWLAEPLGSATTLRKLHRDHASFNDDFIVVCGDALINVDFAEALSKHKQSGASLSIIAKTVPIEDVASYGIIKADRSGRVLDFQEKPEPPEACSSLANVGIYVCDPIILDLLPDRNDLDIANDLIPRIMQAGLSVHVQAPKLTWLDVGCARDYYLAIEGALGGQLNDLRPSGREIRPNVWAHETAVISPKAEITGPCYIGSGATVEPLALIKGPVSIGARSYVSRYSVVKCSVVLPDTHIGENAFVDGQILNGDWSISHAFADGKNQFKKTPLPRVSSSLPKKTVINELERSA